MARRNSDSETDGSTKLPNLALPRDEVFEKLQERFSIGTDIFMTEIDSESKLEGLKNAQSRWDSYNIELLLRCFDNSSISDEYASVPSWGSIMMNPSFYDLVQGFEEGMQNQLNALESIMERLELIPEAHELSGSAQSQSSTSSATDMIGDSVFIVHGQDENAKTSVARFIEKLGLEAKILHEQPNAGQTIIEKFESNAANAGFAVVLLTPDDVAAPKEDPESTQYRARQNVILELGYFCGKLGRERVCVLYKGDVEIPSDYLGVVYTQLDGDGGWNLKLAKEMKAAGLDVDLNRAI